LKEFRKEKKKKTLPGGKKISTALKVAIIRRKRPGQREEERFANAYKEVATGSPGSDSEGKEPGFDKKTAPPNIRGVNKNSIERKKT